MRFLDACGTPKEVCELFSNLLKLAVQWRGLNPEERDRCSSLPCRRERTTLDSLSLSGFQGCLQRRREPCGKLAHFMLAEV
jgi:hypothetical protein